MKKSLLLILLAVMLMLSACAKTPEKPLANNNELNSEAVDDGNKNGANFVGTGSDTILTPEPVKEPAPTPFPTDDVKEYDGYGITYKADKLYNEPDEASYVLTELQKDESLHLIGKYNKDWYYAEHNGTKGFILRTDVATSKSLINADEVKLRKGPSRSTEELQLLSHSTELYTISKNDDWYRVVLNNDEATEGYVFCDYVSYFDGYVTGDDVRIREAPDSSAKTITRIEQGKRISIICKYENWYKITVGEFSGFMSADYIEYSATVRKLETKDAHILENGVNFREGPSTECKSIQRLAKYSPVKVTGETDEWYRVKCNNVEGFVSKDFVEFGKLEVYVTEHDVNLRAGPGTNYDLLTKVRQNSKFEIIGCDGEWLKGIVNHNTGYMRSDYLSAKTVNGGKKTNEFTSDEVYLAAKVVYLEAKGYGMDAYRAVANVIYNRVKSHRFPNTVKGVVFESGQFSVIHHSGFSSLSPSSDALKATRQVLNEGIRPLPFNVLFFHIATAGRNWGSDKEYYKTIGDNSFFRYVG